MTLIKLDQTVCCRCTSCKSGAFYRVVYDDSYTNEYVKLRAKKTYGEGRYNILGRNCEHSTRWCKTGIHNSRQVEVCFTTTGKAAVVVFLRVFSVIVLWLLQLADEVYDGCENCERIVSGVYMAAIACLFMVYSLYRSGSEIRPKAPSQRYGAFCSIGCKAIRSGRGTICRRPPSIIIGLFFRIFIREIVAATGPLATVYFQDEIVCNRIFCPDSKVGKFLAILALIIVASALAYLGGALAGVVIEASIICCAGCSRCSAPDDDGGNPDERMLVTMREDENAEAMAQSDENLVTPQRAEPVAQPDVYWL